MKYTTISYRMSEERLKAMFQSVPDDGLISPPGVDPHVRGLRLAELDRRKRERGDSVPSDRISFYASERDRNEPRGLSPADRQWLDAAIKQGSIPNDRSTVIGVIQMIPQLVHDRDSLGNALDFVIEQGKTSE